MGLGRSRAKRRGRGSSWSKEKKRNKKEGFGEVRKVNLGSLEMWNSKIILI